MYQFILLQIYYIYILLNYFLSDGPPTTVLTDGSRDANGSALRGKMTILAPSFGIRFIIIFSFEYDNLLKITYLIHKKIII